ncbi:MAG: hypothetical protein P4L79_18580 [Legionella sp.]|uniref:hypothetical protein n=1 Tax=Legionella sp. TaxID=459 RepID=UPI0028468AFF|nr:hypothetical protein [Legionella sp.]
MINPYLFNAVKSDSYNIDKNGKNLLLDLSTAQNARDNQDLLFWLCEGQNYYLLGDSIRLNHIHAVLGMEYDHQDTQLYGGLTANHYALMAENPHFNSEKYNHILTQPITGGLYEGVNGLLLLALRDNFEYLAQMINKVHAPIDPNISCTMTEGASLAALILDAEEWDLFSALSSSEIPINLNKQSRGWSIALSLAYQEVFEELEKISNHPQFSGVNLNQFSENPDDDAVEYYGKSVAWWLAYVRQWDLLRRLIQHPGTPPLNIGSAPLNSDGFDFNMSIAWQMVQDEQWDFLQNSKESFDLNNAPLNPDHSNYNQTIAWSLIQQEKGLLAAELAERFNINIDLNMFPSNQRNPHYQTSGAWLLANSGQWEAFRRILDASPQFIPITSRPSPTAPSLLNLLMDNNQYALIQQIVDIYLMHDVQTIDKLTSGVPVDYNKLQKYLSMFFGRINLINIESYGLNCYQKAQSVKAHALMIMHDKKLEDWLCDNFSADVPQYKFFDLTNTERVLVARSEALGFAADGELIGHLCADNYKEQKKHITQLEERIRQLEERNSQLEKRGVKRKIEEEYNEQDIESTQEPPNSPDPKRYRMF